MRRFIPACAGNAGRRRSRRSSRQVHPRVCGERPGESRPPFPGSGSSPRVRGTPHTAYAGAITARFIPACAGNATSRSAPPVGASVHPRVCGERLPTRARRQPWLGSSPRVRGTRRQRRGHQPDRRFIPACAGNAPATPPWMPSRPVHPRVCGERTEPFLPAKLDDGSSPRVRGTLDPAVLPDARRRFIPACAGNAPIRPPGEATGAVHPRVCGERSGRSTMMIWLVGSSPRVRGTRRGRQRARVRLRFIPACAGNAAKILRCVGAEMVHPRVCGERSCSKSLVRNMFHNVKELTKCSY